MEEDFDEATSKQSNVNKIDLMKVMVKKNSMVKGIESKVR